MTVPAWFTMACMLVSVHFILCSRQLLQAYWLQWRTQPRTLCASSAALAFVVQQRCSHDECHGALAPLDVVAGAPGSRCAASRARRRGSGSWPCP